MTTRKNHPKRIKARRETALYNLERRVNRGHASEEKLNQILAEIAILQRRIASAA